MVRWHLLGGLLLAMASADVASAAEEKDTRKVVVNFDFVSKFDSGKLGAEVGDMIWKKLSREKAFIIPEAMQDVRDWCSQQKFTADPAMDLAKMKDVAKDGFGADIVIFGGVERAPGERWEIYDLVIKCVDFSSDPPNVIYQCNNRTEAASEIPHLYIKNMMNALLDRQPGDLRGPDPIMDENWQKNKNLVTGGDFEKSAGGVPTGWESRGGQLREPLGHLVRWLPEAGNEKNHVIRLTFDKPLGDSFGVMYYSKPFPIEEGATYRFQCRYRHTGCNVKIFLKCYDSIPSGDFKVSAGGADGAPTQDRECYRCQMNLKGAKNQWNDHTEDFTPKHTKYSPKSGRVMLYGYLGAGAVEFDDIVCKQVLPPPQGVAEKVKRHSLDTKVTMKEMEENEQRSNELKRKAKAEAGEMPATEEKPSEEKKPAEEKKKEE